MLEIKYDDFKNELSFDEDWYIDIQIDLIFNDNNYYHKYVKKVVNELFVLMKKDFLSNYIKLDYVKKGESYYRNHQEEFLSKVISLFDKLNSLTKNTSEQKRKKKNKKKKNKNTITTNNNDINTNDNENYNDNEEESEMKEQDIDNNIKYENIEEIKNIGNNNINDDNNIEEKMINNTKNILDNEKKGEILKNKNWFNNLGLNREELEFTNNNIFEKSQNKENDKLCIKSNINTINEEEIPEKDKEIKISSKVDIEKKF